MGALRFLLNDRLVATDAPGGLAVLDFVRREAGLTGTKEGCKEGDCGACVVLVGELEGGAEGPRVRYLPVTSCLMPLAELQHRHVVTIEGLDLGRLSTVQQAIVDEGASQCGFCTPGIVVSLTALRLVDEAPALVGRPDGGTEHALSGHLCRCTGYRSLRAAGQRVLTALGSVTGVASLVARGELPAWFADVPARLAALADEAASAAGERAAGSAAALAVPGLSSDLARGLPGAAAQPGDPGAAGRPSNPGDPTGAAAQPGDSGATGRRSDPGTAGRPSNPGDPGAGAPASGAGAAGRPLALPLVAGGTDLYVQRGDALAAVPVRALAAEPRRRGVDREDGELVIGAGATFEELANDALLVSRLPELPHHLEVVASWQIRNRATVGGNLMNASPIGDLTVLLLALGGRAVFVGAGGERRDVPLRSLYLGYKRLDRRPDEVLVEVRVPDLAPVGGAPGRDLVDFDKVAKRRHLDIASVNSAVRLRLGGVGGAASAADHSADHSSGQLPAHSSGHLLDQPAEQTAGDTAGQTATLEDLSDRVITEAGIAVGGVAPVPLFLARTSALLVGRRIDAATVATVLACAQSEIAPIDDIRGSAAYKRLLVRQLLVGHFARLFPGNVDVASFSPAPPRAEPA